MEKIYSYKSEADLQAKCFKYFDRKYPEQKGRLRLIYNNPPNAIIGALLKSMGLVKGTSDQVYFANDGKMVWIEYKLVGMYQSDEQEKFEKLVRQWKHDYVIIQTETEFINLMYLYNGH